MAESRRGVEVLETVTPEQWWLCRSSLTNLPMHVNEWNRLARARWNLRLLSVLKSLEQKKLPYFLIDGFRERQS